MGWTIYAHTHRATGRKYVGLTVQSVERRWHQHCYRARTGERTYFYNAIRVHGPEAFEHEALEMCVSLAEANAAEAAWVERFDSRNPERGFNVMPGGLAYEPHRLSRNPWTEPDFRERQLAVLVARNAKAKLRTHCKHGHEFTADNTAKTAAGHRACRACLRRLTAEWRRRNPRDRIARVRDAATGQFQAREEGRRVVR
jgi:hypothetical protein